MKNFTQQQSTFSVGKKVYALPSDTVTNLPSYLDLLYYVAYNNVDRAMNPPQIQDSTMANMGMITDSLPAGNYRMYFVAGKKGLALNSYGVLGEAAFGYGPAGWQDTFWGTTGNVTVGNANINKDITLNRVVTKIELQILDNIPANADSLKITIQYDDAIMFFDKGYLGPGSTSPAAVVAIKIPDAAKGHPLTIDKIFGNTLDPVTVDILCKNASGTVLGHAIVNNVLGGQNTKVVIAGNLFNSGNPSSSPQSFTVKVDTAWNNTPLHSGF